MHLFKIWFTIMTDTRCTTPGSSLFWLQLHLFLVCTNTVVKTITNGASREHYPRDRPSLLFSAVQYILLWYLFFVQLTSVFTCSSLLLWRGASGYKLVVHSGPTATYCTQASGAKCPQASVQYIA